jgi:hypothetical protein
MNRTVGIGRRAILVPRLRTRSVVPAGRGLGSGHSGGAWLLIAVIFAAVGVWLFFQG